MLWVEFSFRRGGLRECDDIQEWDNFQAVHVISSGSDVQSDEGDADVRSEAPCHAAHRRGAGGLCWVLQLD